MSKALLRHIRLSPTKARLVAREVQGMNAELALASLEFTPNKAARVIAKVIASAVANGSYDAQEVVVLSCRVDAGPVLRRFTPRARGRATPIRKPTSHIFVEVGSKKAEQKTQKADSKVETKKAEPKKQAIKKVETKADSKVVAKDSAESKPKTTKTTKTAGEAKPKSTKAQTSKKSEGEGK